MPGVESLRLQQYYGHGQNAFWKILLALYDLPVSANYEDRKDLLLKNKIALWDVLKACEREGSLDSDICEEEANDIKGFLKAHPSITHIFFNGQKAQSFFKKYVKGVELSHTVLPSTSPAHTLSFQKKLEAWSIVMGH